MKTTEDRTIHLDDLKGWGRLEKSKQQAVRNATAATKAALTSEADSKLEVGRNLNEVRKLLPRSMFLAWMKANFGMSRATGYRYMNHYTATSKKLPKPVLEIVMRRAYRPEQIKRIEENPPKTDDPVKIGRHLDKLETTPREVKSMPAPNPDTSLKECVNFVASRFQRLSGNTTTKIGWLRALVGMLMTKFGLGTEQRFEPLAIPDGFKSIRGRRKKAA